jgi:hypothetical protein
MQQSAEASLMSFIPLLLVSVLLGIVGHFLAKDKERPVLRWTILCIIPVVNLYCLMFLIGSTSLKLERKLDEILKAQGRTVDYR